LAWKQRYVKLLIDTHVFLWLMDEPDKLSRKALEACQNRENQIYLSVVCAWEIEIKRQLGKLTLKLPLSTIINEQQERNGLEILVVELQHVLAVGQLLRHHADPFDRLLIAQALVEDVNIVTSDPLFTKYPVKLYW
jgi:PIN domain nuclease of toxin-antitoxin system